MFPNTSLFLFLGLIIIVDDSTNLTSWFISSDSDSQSYDGVEISKRDNGILVSYRDGMIVCIVTDVCFLVSLDLHCN